MQLRKITPFVRILKPGLRVLLHQKKKKNCWAWRILAIIQHLVDWGRNASSRPTSAVLVKQWKWKTLKRICFNFFQQNTPTSKKDQVFRIFGFQFKVDATAELNEANFALMIVLFHSWFLKERTTEGKCPIFPAHCARTIHYLDAQNKFQPN